MEAFQEHGSHVFCCRSPHVQYDIWRNFPMGPCLNSMWFPHPALLWCLRGRTDDPQ